MRTCLLSILGLSLVFSACSNEKKSGAPNVPEVSVVEVTQSKLPVYAEFVGQAYGLSDVVVQARVQGLITGMFFKEGTQVKEGQLLYTIDDLPYKAKLAGADGQLADAETQLVKAKSDLDRIKPLSESNALSKRDLDAAIAAVGAAEGRVKAARAARENAQIELGYCRVIAPISGLIGISQLNVGDFAGTMDTRKLNTISNLSEIRVRFAVSETEYLNYLEKRKKNNTTQPTHEVDLYLSNGSKYPHAGHFTAANREIDAATGSIIIEVTTPNPDGMLRPGQYVKVRFIEEEVEGAILVPQRAVQQMQNLFQVCLLGDSNKVETRMVTTGQRVGESWVITSGLKAGEKVLLLGNRMIKANMVVKPMMVEQKDSLSK